MGNCELRARNVLLCFPASPLSRGLGASIVPSARPGFFLEIDFTIILFFVLLSPDIFFPGQLSKAEGKAMLSVRARSCTTL